jgi:hypothetical protein
MLNKKTITSDSDLNDKKYNGKSTAITSAIPNPLVIKAPIMVSIFFCAIC